MTPTLPLDPHPPGRFFLDLPGGGRLDLPETGTDDDDVVVEIIDDDDDEGDRHLIQLGRELCGQYVELMAAFASAVFRAREVQARLVELEPALGSLTRLAEATPDPELLDLFGELRVIADGAAPIEVGPRTLLLARLRRWLQRAALVLGEERGGHLRRLVELDTAHAPLLAHLSTVRGVGPRRLERLFAAGLHSLDSLIGADPAEVAAVSGLPHGVARAVVDAVAGYAADRPAHIADELRTRAEEVGGLLAGLEPDSEAHRALRAATRETIARLEAALALTPREVP